MSCTGGGRTASDGVEGWRAPACDGRTCTGNVRPAARLPAEELLALKVGSIRGDVAGVEDPVAAVATVTEFGTTALELTGWLKKRCTLLLCRGVSMPC